MTVPIYFITGLLLTSWISHIVIPTHAAPNSLRSPQQLNLPAVPKELIKDSWSTDKNVEKTSVRKSTEGAKFKEKELRLIESVIGIGIDKLADVLTGVSNVLNSRSNIEAVDKFMAAFTSLFNSTGGNNLYVYYYIFSNFWVVFDAMAMIFRVWEDRFKERQANVEALQTQQESDSQILETLEALSEANARLTLLKDSLNSLVRRKDIQRKGLAALKQGFEKKTIYLHSGLDVMDDDSVDEENEEEEDEDEGPVDEDGTEDANSSQEDTGTPSDNNRQDTNPSILVNQEFGENDIPE
ncbi:uncharacterized protein LOC124192627 isoform X1 [Daphnia pulex]|uniref:uncharacterized protein LOC124192627 isoform X1 n=1 Tax=Daphnia pulex TaxID=6669 RepID=UPI001EDCBB46|nr:uncharacterized protein LOC124192627 isoform X1 [Daphnia pulex]XP_046441985.1 uncharacterized protein LOC124192627 isoform X1 [Daphnia pulex]XP_046441986.1 uncharacterized protein LOC124192627 isoform X1 [Daphnia pulex]XP_046441988.1 uncharacterized protein LOC124192627 isoform X1 [Daphnia pulex]XP_046441989.1 uncharacterized protein LOC124192627 isoform X1 [Daphnia pulex]